jgi:hypothetical protein
MNNTIQMMKKRLRQNKRAARYFATRLALCLEGTPESRKAAKAMITQFHGNRFPHPGEYFQPRLSAR